MAVDSPKRNHGRRELRRHLDRLVLVTFAAATVAPLIAAAAEPVSSRMKGPAVLRAVTTNFTVRSCRNGPDATELAGYCETLRRHIRKRWLDDATDERWQPRCEVVLHASKNSYVRAVGNHAVQTSGSSLIKQQENRIILRRIDLLVDQLGNATALPHELTHVVLADEFGGQPPPPWLDEGLATLADPAEKRARHSRDCYHAVRSGRAFPLIELLTLDSLSSADQIPAFYGQSVSLVRFLAERDEPTKLLPFTKLAMTTGYDRALRTSYGIDGIGQLERLWFADLASTGGNRHFDRVAVLRQRRPDAEGTP